MTDVLRILSVFPELLNVNGDAENAAVLAARSRWAGRSARVVRLGLNDPTPTDAPGIVVIGSTTDAALPSVLDALSRSRSALAEWIAAGVPVLAVGTGWEALSTSIALADGVVDGLGLVPGSAATADARVSDDLVITSRFGRLVGYENHARDYTLEPGTEPLGEIVYGRGNGLAGSSEGMIVGNIIGTHLHGPVLAKNPTLADHLLTLALGEGYDSRTVSTGRVDDIARAARNVIATRLELGTE
jgi:CobQ-like glutamine amidotransferase family enzyme